MVARGIRKRFNNDLDAQIESVQRANYERWAALDRKRLRFSVAWYHAASGQWLEVEVDSFHQVMFNSYPETPARHIIKFSVTSKETENYIVECGFIADGLLHGVWISGGKWEHDKEHGSRICFDKDKSKCKLYQQLVVNITRLPQIFLELYGLQISIPQIRQAFRVYQDAAQDT